MFSDKTLVHFRSYLGLGTPQARGGGYSHLEMVVAHLDKLIFKHFGF